jgi:hypothetical protein
MATVALSGIITPTNFVTATSTTTLTNKTLTGAVMNGTLGATTPSTVVATTVKASTTMGVGGATPSASGSGISFPATQSASTDANTLDDYEEGTWTPELTFANPGSVSVGYSGREGFYVKIGRLVHFSGIVKVSSFSKGTASGTLRVNGLPFTAQNPSNNETPINWSVYETPLPTSAGQFPTPIVEDNLTCISFIYASNNAANSSWPDPDSSCEYKFNGCYQTD